MRKIPTLFVRDPDNPRRVIDEITPGTEWVLGGAGVATVKWDGTCTMLDEDGDWWARREVREGRPFPTRYLPVSTDPNTGKTVGWEPIEQSPFRKAFLDASWPTEPGTYELVGPNVNGNPHCLVGHRLVPHGEDLIPGAPRSFETLRAYLLDASRPPFAFTSYIEGIVFWECQGDADGAMAKIKTRDFR